MSDHEDNYQEDEDYENEGIDFRQHLTKFPPHESFDVSSFTQSKNGVEIPSKYIKKGFPKTNAPTLQVSPDSKMDYLNGFRAQNIVTSHDHSESKISSLQQQIDFLKRQIKERQKLQDSYVQQIKQLNNGAFNLEKIIREKDIIIREKEELLLIQERKIRELQQNTIRSKSSLSKEKPKNEGSYIDDFCPELLSPQESLQLFTELLTKIDKSTSIKKKINRDRKIMELLNKLTKTQ